MVGIDFYVADNKKEAASSTKCIKLEERVHDYLLAREFRDSFELLTGLDQYGDKLFSGQEINQLIKVCEALKGLCLEALKLNKLVFAAGD